MLGGLLKSTSRLALIAAAGFALGGVASAQAADLGGDCCADLEERVAELEATTARKGNRKVSLTVSGQVNELVWWWDDGVESNVYQGSSGFSNTRFRFRGDAAISSDWSAGYYLEIQALTASVSSQTQNNDDAGATVSVRHSAWYLKSKSLGTLWVGQYSFATDDITSAIGLGGTATATQANIDSAPGVALTFQGLGGGVLIAPRTLFEFLDTDRGNLVRYDSPTIGGFIFSAAWGEDDMWDVALRYAGEFAGFKVAGAIGYHVEVDATGDAGPNITRLVAGEDFDEVVGAISILHEPSGLFADFAGIHREFDNPALPDFEYWYVRGGIYKRFIALGKTSIFGEYGEATDGGVGLSFGGNQIVSSEGKVIGVGVQQQIDAAAMEVYLGWRRFEGDVDTVNNQIVTHRKADDIDTVYSGARIQF